MCSKQGYHNNCHKYCNDGDDDDYEYDVNDNTVSYHNYSTNSYKKLQIFKLKGKYVWRNTNVLVGRQQLQ